MLYKELGGFQQRLQILLDDLIDYLYIHIKIAMSNPVSQAKDLLLRNLRTIR